MSQPLKGKVAIITGAGRGLGRSMAVGFAEAGADVVLAARTMDQLEETAEMVKAAGGRSLIVSTNVAEEDQANNLAEKTIAEYGKIDVLINNAGITSPDSFLTQSFKRWKLVLSVNLDGMFLCTKAVLPHMLEKKSGMVINVSSILAHQIRMNVSYGVTKAGTERFTMGLAREMRKEPGIAITCVRPYFVKTDVVLGFTEGHDISDYEELIVWQKYPALLAGAKPQDVTGKIFDKAALEEKFGKI
jgi:NAD(P)-dependent dehydrogenase (short-subunit alcohol dehydrogenase family)